MSSHPVVLLCRGCAAVISDTTSLAFSDHAGGTLAVRGANSVTEEMNAVARDDPSVPGCSFHRLMCACGAPVGRVYVTTRPSLAHLKDVLVLDTDAISSYQVGGSFELRAEGGGGGEHTAGAMQLRGIAGGVGGASMEDRLRISKLEEQMIKVENLMLLHAQMLDTNESRVTAVMERVELGSSAPNPWGAGGTHDGGRVMTMPQAPIYNRYGR